MEDNAITFEIPGQPVPQPRPRVSTRGGFARAYTPKDHAIHPYREAIRLLAKAHGWESGATDLPIAVEIDFWFPRLKSHLGRGDSVKPTAPRWPKADCDNLAKGVLDAITDSASFWHDDDQVLELVVRKAYARPGGPGRTIITVRRLPP